MIKIYDFPHGARGLRAAWLCEEMGLPHTFAPVGFPPDDGYRELNPFGTVPFLQDDDVSMSESVAMMFYIAQKYGPTDALPPAEDERRTSRGVSGGRAMAGAGRVAGARFCEASTSSRIVGSPYGLFNCHAC